MLSTLLCGCGYRGIGALKISLVNEVQCGTGTEWRDLIGQHMFRHQGSMFGGILRQSLVGGKRCYCVKR